MGDLDGKTKKLRRNAGWQVKVTIIVHDGTEGAVARATVYGHWNDDGGTSVSCLTGAKRKSGGKCSISLAPLDNGVDSVSFTVDAIAADGYTYNAANHDPDGDSDGTSITVTR